METPTSTPNTFSAYSVNRILSDATTTAVLQGLGQLLAIATVIRPSKNRSQTNQLLHVTCLLNHPPQAEIVSHSFC